MICDVESDDIKIYYTGKVEDFTARYKINSSYVSHKRQGRSQDICNIEADAIGVGRVPKAGPRGWRGVGEVHERGAEPDPLVMGFEGHPGENFENSVRIGGIW